MSTDLTLKRRVYIDRLTSYIDLYMTSFVNDTQLLCTLLARTVTVCRVILYAPGRALFPPFQSYVSTAMTLPRAGFLPLF